jgi:hypothetical protein
MGFASVDFPIHRADWEPASNARKHGLAVPITNDQRWAHRIESLTLEIADDDNDRLRMEEARIIAEAELDLVRVRTARARLLELSGIAQVTQTEPRPRKIGSGTPLLEAASDKDHEVVTSEAGLGALEQLILLDRYERRALSRRNRAIRRLF